MASQPSDENDPWSAKHKQKFRRYSCPSAHLPLSRSLPAAAAVVIWPRELTTCPPTYLARFLSLPIYSKNKSEWYDPCQEAASKSIQCLNRNGGDRTMCQDYFQAYRDCKKNWTTRRRNEVEKSDPTPDPEA
ncbi:hypothetical protein MAPG_11338 [Magnaporthiopsis poae ATCC 64411]|uniref:CHCH domain-containing protein n=1 Tax=Magnaporthiopsis poae (strain ATCC 64411 / 73-15) TaxID=644358 RepID=A0A0C4EF04_MAGP6|nr:hypothetical protein MAPG_11338 [Magnaporthiopsis poae ATCC 64411]